MKVLLVYPPRAKSLGWLWCPLGLSYIGAVLQEAGHEVKGVDLRCQPPSRYTHLLYEWGPDFVGFSVDTQSWLETTKQLIQAAKLRGATTIIGGPHASVCPNEVISFDGVDIVVVGEGEETVKDLVSNIPLSNVKGILYKNGNTVRTTPKRPPIKSLDALPFPSRELFPVTEYLRFSYFNFPLPGPSLHLIASRGCPWECTFCQPALQTIFGRGVRFRSVTNVVDEIRLLVEKYKLRGFHLEDDLPLINKKWILEFCNRLIQEGLNDIAWYCQSRVDTLDDERAKALRKAGCIALWVGFESGSNKILDYYNKGTTVEQGCEFVKICKKYGLIILANFMVGAPIETVEDLDLTAQFFNSIDPEIARTHVTTPVPGTYLYKKCAEDGTLLFRDYSDLDRLYAIPKMKTAVSARTIQEFRDSCERMFPNLRLYLNERYYRRAVDRWLFSILRSRYLPWTIGNILTLLTNFWREKSRVRCGYSINA